MHRLQCCSLRNVHHLPLTGKQLNPRGSDLSMTAATEPGLHRKEHSPESSVSLHRSSWHIHQPLPEAASLLGAYVTHWDGLATQPGTLGYSKTCADRFSPDQTLNLLPVLQEPDLFRFSGVFDLPCGLRYSPAADQQPRRVRPGLQVLQPSADP